MSDPAGIDPSLQAWSHGIREKHHEIPTNKIKYFVTKFKCRQARQVESNDKIDFSNLKGVVRREHYFSADHSTKPQ
ncbi:MAG: hypothetical protein LBV61_04550 [Burkholderiaceae bacterium]|nr:hypothetical protein [Burkholderiaceae bacterium]